MSATAIRCACIDTFLEDRLAGCCWSQRETREHVTERHLTEEAKVTSSRPLTGRHPENGWGLVPSGTCPNPKRKRHPPHWLRPALFRQHGSFHVSGGTLRRGAALDLVLQNHTEDLQPQGTRGRHSQPLETGYVSKGSRERLPKGKASPAA